MTEFIVESSPHTFSHTMKFKIMWVVFLALLPAAAYGVYIFGMHSLYIIITSIVTAVIADAIFIKIEKKSLLRALDGSTFVTGLLLAMVVPPTLPLFVVSIGSFFSVAIAKHAFGGAGMTLFNPALVGRAFLAACFPVLFAGTAYFWPDGVTSATPLTELKLQGMNSAISQFGSKFVAYKSLFIGNVAGSIGETSALLLLLGGLLLILMKIVDWRVPTFYIGTVALLSWLFGQDPLFHVLAGGLFIGAFFMATDYAGMPITKSGRIYFAIGIGIITVAIRIFGGYPEGVNYAILIMNAATPLIERFTQPKPFGYKKGAASAAGK